MSAGEGVQGEECRGRNAGVRSEGEGVQREECRKRSAGWKSTGGRSTRVEEYTGRSAGGGIHLIWLLSPVDYRPSLLMFNAFKTIVSCISFFLLC